MTDLEINIAIAKTQGYRVEYHPSDSVYGPCYHVAKPWHTGWGELVMPENLAQAFPNYAGDKALIDPLTERLSDQQFEEYLGQLADQVGEKWTDGVTKCPKTFKSTARQRSIAFLKTTKLKIETLPPCPTPPSIAIETDCTTQIPTSSPRSSSSSNTPAAASSTSNGTPTS